MGDDPDCVAANRKRLREQLSLPSDPEWLTQIHGPRAICIDNGFSDRQADASYSFAKGAVCAVLTADCLPILISDQCASCVAVIHGGWRGLLAGVIENTVKALGNRKLMAWLGPAIGPNAFVVGEEVHALFVEKDRAFEPAFERQGPKNLSADLNRIARIVLQAQGVKEIYGGEFCTYSDVSRFFSFRRDGKTGRIATLIWRE